MLLTQTIPLLVKLVIKSGGNVLFDNPKTGRNYTKDKNKRKNMLNCYTFLGIENIYLCYYYIKNNAMGLLTGYENEKSF